MLKTPSPLRSYSAPGSRQPGDEPGTVTLPAVRGAGSSPQLRWNFFLKSLIAPSSFHLNPESCTAMSTSERPVCVRHAVSTLMPVTPKSSLALRFTIGSVEQKLVLAYFHLLPLQLPAAPVISFGSGMQRGGLADVSQRFGSARNGNSARAAELSAASAMTTTDFQRMADPPPCRADKTARAIH